MPDFASHLRFYGTHPWYAMLACVLIFVVWVSVLWTLDDDGWMRVPRRR